ncbi:unnamed protein product [Gordionus sp. m RMFG-2023]
MMKLPIWGYEYLNKGDGQNFIYLKCRSNNGGRAKLSLADVVITKQHIYTLIKGCFFHYSQALWRECQALGLVRDYLNDSYVHLVVRRMTTLPFCKEEHMAEVRLSCYSIATKYPSLLRFMEYMDHTWLGETALFPQTIRTRYHVDGPRTNNHLEGFHHALKRKTRSAHPNVYVLIKILIENQNSNDIKLIQIHNGSIVRRANRTYERLNYKIDNLTSMYDRAPLNLLPFF